MQTYPRSSRYWWCIFPYVKQIQFWWCNVDIRNIFQRKWFNFLHTNRDTTCVFFSNKQSGFMQSTQWRCSPQPWFTQKGISLVIVNRNAKAGYLDKHMSSVKQTSVAWWFVGGLYDPSYIGDYFIIIIIQCRIPNKNQQSSSKGFPIKSINYIGDFIIQSRTHLESMAGLSGFGRGAASAEPQPGPQDAAGRGMGHGTSPKLPGARLPGFAGTDSKRFS